MSSNVVMCFAILSAIITLLVGQYIGNLCIMSQTGIRGKCALIENCLSAIAGLKRKERPQSCGFLRLSPIVCCPTVLDNKPSAPITKNYNRKNVRTNKSIVGDISLQKCREFSKLSESKNCPLILEENADYRIAQPQEFSHMALIGFDSRWTKGKSWECSGNLISESYVLTNLGCLFSHVSGYAKYVKLGGIVDNNVTTSKYVQFRNISELIRYPRYLNRQKEKILALIKLSTPANINEYVRPACLHRDVNINDLFHSNDWPYFLSDEQSFENPMHKVTMKIVEKELCKTTYNYVNDQHICAALIPTENGKQCSPKGALQRLHPDVRCMNTLVGIEISSRGCENALLPVLYAKINDYLEWIEKNVWGNKYNL